MLYYPTVQVGSPRLHGFPTRDALGVSLLVAPLGRRKSRSPEGPPGLEIWVAGGWAGSRDPVSPLWDLDRPTWPLLSGYKSVAQAPPGQADLAGEVARSLLTLMRVLSAAARFTGAGPGAQGGGGWTPLVSGRKCRSAPA